MRGPTSAKKKVRSEKLSLPSSTPTPEEGSSSSTSTEKKIEGGGGNGATVPNLQVNGLPFNHCKLVLGLKEKEGGGDEEETKEGLAEKSKSEFSEGWNKNKEGWFVYYDGVTLEEKEKLKKRMEGGSASSSDSESSSGSEWSEVQDEEEVMEEEVMEEEVMEEEEDDLFELIIKKPKSASKKRRSSKITGNDELVKSEAASSIKLEEEDNQDEYVESDDEDCQIMEALYKCPFCFLIYAKAENLISHLDTHMEVDPNSKSEDVNASSDPFPSQDDQTFDTEDEDAKVEKKVILCEICGKALSSVNAKNVHMRIHTDERPFICRHCPFSFRQLSHLQKHERKVHNETAVTRVPTKPKKMIHKPRSLPPNPQQQSLNSGSPRRKKLAMTKCSKTATVQIKQKKLARGSKWKCNVCGRKFAWHYKPLHMMIHRDERPFQCQHCSFSFRQPSHLQRHMSLHDKSRPFKCSKCPFHFQNKSTLSIHDSVKHKVNNEGACNDAPSPPGSTMMTSPHGKVSPCRVILSRCDNLAQQIHQTPKPDRVAYEKMKNQSKKSKTSQMKLHTNPDDKPFQCQLCGQKFRQKWSLQKHAKAHDPTRPFKCTRCSLTFLSKARLLNHNFRTHRNRKSFQCEQCDSSFRHLRFLQLHMMFHDSTRPWKCASCNLYFLSSPGLTVHEVWTHGKESKRRSPKKGKSTRLSVYSSKSNGSFQNSPAASSSSSSTPEAFQIQSAREL